MDAARVGTIPCSIRRITTIMNSTEQQLQQVFADNFVAYFRSHVAHVNITGRNFYSDHKLLGKVYEDLQSQIDVIAELLRTVNEMMPVALDEVLLASAVAPAPCEGSADELLESVLMDLEQLKDCYEELMEISEVEEHKEIANYAQDRILALAKFIWQFRSTLGLEQEPEEDEDEDLDLESTFS